MALTGKRGYRDIKKVPRLNKLTHESAYERPLKYHCESVSARGAVSIFLNVTGEPQGRPGSR